jgi:pantothenate kinase
MSHHTEIVTDPDELTARACRLLGPGRRAVLGLTGSPGAGKTTLALALVERVNAERGAGTAVHLPMDGFHLANATLDRLGRHDRKGALDTFDGWGFVALVRRLRDERGHEIYAPSFRRTVDEPIAGEIAVPAGAALVVLEGNYLLVDSEPWDQVRPLLDEAWFCVTPPRDRLLRLVDRHTRHGRSTESAASWATEVDGANAELIEQTQGRADLLVSGTAELD